MEELGVERVLVALDEAIDAVEKSARLQPDHKGIADRLKSYRRLQLQLKNHNSQ